MNIGHGCPGDAAGPGRRRDRVLTWPQVAELVPYSRQHVGRLEAHGAFPRRLQIGPGRVGWWEGEILGWLGQRRRGALRPRQSRGRRRAGSPAGAA